MSTKLSNAPLKSYIGGNLKPGRELDALVAEKVMGLTPWPGQPGAFIAPFVLHYQTPKPCMPPEYSTDITAAWAVVEKLKTLPDAKGWGVMVGATLEGNYVCWLGFGCSEDADICRHGETAPHAICLAALQALESK